MSVLLSRKPTIFTQLRTPQPLAPSYTAPASPFVPLQEAIAQKQAASDKMDNAAQAALVKLDLENLRLRDELERQQRELQEVWKQNGIKDAQLAQKEALIEQMIREKAELAADVDLMRYQHAADERIKKLNVNEEMRQDGLLDDMKRRIRRLLTSSDNQGGVQRDQVLMDQLMRELGELESELRQLRKRNMQLQEQLDISQAKLAQEQKNNSRSARESQIREDADVLVLFLANHTSYTAMPDVVQCAMRRLRECLLSDDFSKFLAPLVSAKVQTDALSLNSHREEATIAEQMKTHAVEMSRSLLNGKLAPPQRKTGPDTESRAIQTHQYVGSKEQQTDSVSLEETATQAEVVSIVSRVSELLPESDPQTAGKLRMIARQRSLQNGVIPNTSPVELKARNKSQPFEANVSKGKKKPTMVKLVRDKPINTSAEFQESFSDPDEKCLTQLINGTKPSENCETTKAPQQESFVHETVVAPVLAPVPQVEDSMPPIAPVTQIAPPAQMDFENYQPEHGSLLHGEVSDQSDDEQSVSGAVQVEAGCRATQTTLTLKKMAQLMARAEANKTPPKLYAAPKGSKASLYPADPPLVDTAAERPRFNKEHHDLFTEQRRLQKGAKRQKATAQPYEHSEGPAAGIEKMEFSPQTEFLRAELPSPRASKNTQAPQTMQAAQQRHIRQPYQPEQTPQTSLSQQSQYPQQLQESQKSQQPRQHAQQVQQLQMSSTQEQEMPILPQEKRKPQIPRNRSKLTEKSDSASNLNPQDMQAHQKITSYEKKLHERKQTSVKNQQQIQETEQLESSYTEDPPVVQEELSGDDNTNAQRFKKIHRKQFTKKEQQHLDREYELAITGLSKHNPMAALTKSAIKFQSLGTQPPSNFPVQIIPTKSTAMQTDADNPIRERLIRDVDAKFDKVTAISKAELQFLDESYEQFQREKQLSGQTTTPQEQGITRAQATSPPIDLVPLVLKPEQLSMSPRTFQLERPSETTLLEVIQKKYQNLDLAVSQDHVLRPPKERKLPMKPRKAAPLCPYDVLKAVERREVCLENDSEACYTFCFPDDEKPCPPLMMRGAAEVPYETMRKAHKAALSVADFERLTLAPQKALAEALAGFVPDVGEPVGSVSCLHLRGCAAQVFALLGEAEVFQLGETRWLRVPFDNVALREVGWVSKQIQALLGAFQSVPYPDQSLDRAQFFLSWAQHKFGNKTQLGQFVHAFWANAVYWGCFQPEAALFVRAFSTLEVDFWLSLNEMGAFCALRKESFYDARKELLSRFFGNLIPQYQQRLLAAVERSAPRNAAALFLGAMISQRRRAYQLSTGIVQLIKGQQNTESLSHSGFAMYCQLLGLGLSADSVRAYFDHYQRGGFINRKGFDSFFVQNCIYRYQSLEDYLFQEAANPMAQKLLFQVQAVANKTRQITQAVVKQIQLHNLVDDQLGKYIRHLDVEYQHVQQALDLMDCEVALTHLKNLCATIMEIMLIVQPQHCVLAVSGTMSALRAILQ